MGIAHRYVEAADVIVTVWDGLVTPAEWSEVVRRQLAGPSSSRGKRRLTDTRTADPSSITASDVEAISATYERAEMETSGVKLAIVANKGWATAQQVETAMRKLGVSTVVFNDVHTACAWLGVDPDLVAATIHEIRQELRRSSGDD